jgi:hypothetical protein
MKRLSFILLAAILLAGAALGALSAPSLAQVIQERVYVYPPPPANPAATPWVGPNTPWVFYSGDWFYKGTLYYYFGPAYGWAPYFAYEPRYISRPSGWYNPRWSAWYKDHPEYVEDLLRVAPYWQKHQIGHVYDEDFYILHQKKGESRWHKAWRELREDND